MNESGVRRRLRAAMGEPTYPPYLTSRVAARIGKPAEQGLHTSVLTAIAVTLTVAIVASILFGVHAFRAQAPMPVTRPVSLLPGGAKCPTNDQIDQIGANQAINMVTPSTGWASGGLRTTDGGAQWRSVLPKAVTEPSTAIGVHAQAYADFYLDQDHAWAVRTFASPRACLDYAQVFSTSDAGSTWSRPSTISFHLPADVAPTKVELTFLDSRKGFLWLTAGSVVGADSSHNGISADEGLLYATNDGGLTWRFLSILSSTQLGFATSDSCPRPFSDVTFSSSAVGWVSVACATTDPEVMVTRDGGASWTVQRLPNPNPCSCVYPEVRFLDSNHGVAELFSNPVFYGPSSLLGTSDGGRTWSALPPIPSSGFSTALAFEDANRWWDVVTGAGFTKYGDATRDSLYVSRNGGQTWTLVQADLPLGFPVYNLTFFNQTNGFAMQPADATTGTPRLDGKVEILQTLDGGHTWSSIVAQQSPG